jgi:uncharacterized membrane protein YcaP (DUF421 family)
MNGIAEFFDGVLGLSVHTAQELNAAQICARAAVVYIALIAYVRFGKKRFLGQATAFDAVLVIIIGSLASRAVSGTAPFFGSLAGTFVFILIHWVLSYFTESSPALSRLIKGSDTLLIKDGRIDKAALEDAHMSMDDLEEDLRQQGVEDPKEVKRARLERSGKVSVIRK